MKSLSVRSIQAFNHPQTIGMISSFPAFNKEVAEDNAVARYTHLLVTNFNHHQKIVVFAEKRTQADQPYLLQKNILVIPTYQLNSPAIPAQILQAVKSFPQLKRIYFQFELGIFGNPIVTLTLPILLATLRLTGKYVSIMLHQVVTDLKDMAGHIGVEHQTPRYLAYQFGLKWLYAALTQTAHEVLVHDQELREKLLSTTHCSPQKISVIPHGILPEKKLSASEIKKARQNLGFTDQETVVLVYGYQSWYKGTDWAVDQLQRLNQAYPARRITLLLAGSLSPTQKNNPAYQSFVKKLDTLLSKYPDHLNLGFVPEEKVRSIFAAADVVLYPYRAKMSASGALSLAWQYRKPFLVSTACSDNFKNPDISLTATKLGLDLNQVTFSLTNARQFKQKLFTLLDHPTLQQKQATFGAQIQTHRSWKKMAQNYVQSSATPSSKNRNWAEWLRLPDILPNLGYTE